MSFTCPRGKSLLENCRQVLFETQICPGPIATNVYVYDGLGFEARHCPTLLNEIKKLYFKFTHHPKLA